MNLILKTVNGQITPLLYKHPEQAAQNYILLAKEMGVIFNDDDDDVNKMLCDDFGTDKLIREVDSKLKNTSYDLKWFDVDIQEGYNDSSEDDLSDVF